MINQITQELYEIINRYPNNKTDVVAALKGAIAAQEYLAAVEMYQGQSAMVLKDILGGQTN